MWKPILLAVSLLAICGGAQAALLSPDQYDPVQFLPPPPAAGTPEALAEIAELKAIAARSTPQMVAAARHDNDDEGPDIFNDALGFDVTAYPATTRLLRVIEEEEDADTKGAKKYFHRPRPWIGNPEIAGCALRPLGPARNSYPSGHSTMAFAAGVVLAALMPDKAQAILARASQYAGQRLVCGVHFRSDIVAGQQLGTVLGLALMRNGDFQRDMAAAKAELAHRGS